MMVTERTGRVRLLKNDVVQPGAFLDLTGTVKSTDEDGLYSMAFHPQYATNHKFFVFFTNQNGDIRVVGYRAGSDDSADANSADTLLAIPHPVAGFTLPFGNHHGGQLQFGPDGKLYVSVGDGGCCGDPQQNGQRHHTLNGKILRIGVDGATGYVVPADNPYVGDTSFAPETWAWGLRNPWRFSFDRQTGDLYIGDVGQDTWEEVDVAAAPNAGKGVNYGWSIMEGTHCYTSPCDQTGLTLPAIDYQHTGGACDVQGGYVYRGTVVTQLIGRYVYADYCTNVVSSFSYSGPVTDKRTWPALSPPGGQIVSFGEDARGEMYLMTYGGTLYRIIESGGP
jgi:glucose/arabinose dehydrogenase